jgi:xanthine dehydrogenase/oxidase
MPSTETALEHLTFSLNMRADQLRARNFYCHAQAVGEKPQYTPYGSPLLYCRINQVWRDFDQKIEFEQRLQDVEPFSQQNRWRRRGLSIIPLKYGISYTFRPMNQGSAYVLAYKEDGSVLLHHGGVEMSQGMHTKMAQIAAEELGLAISQIRVATTNTSVIPNVSSTGASTGSELWSRLKVWYRS